MNSTHIPDILSQSLSLKSSKKVRSPFVPCLAKKPHLESNTSMCVCVCVCVCVCMCV